MQPVSSLLYSQEPTTGTYREPHPCGPQFTTLFPKIQFNFIFPSTLGTSECRLRFRFPAKICYEFLISPMHAACSTHLIIFDLITLIIYGEAYKIRTPHFAVFSSLPRLPS
jgi:hypothetical protein